MAQTPLLFLPGLLEDADAFEHQVLALGRDCRCSVADLAREDTIEGLARQAFAQAGAERFAIAGHSMGGYVAFEMLRQAPERIARVALLNTNARPDTAESKQNRERLMALAERDFPAVIETLLPKLMTPAHAQEIGLTGKVKEMALATGKEGFLRQERAIIARIDSRPHLGRIACPTLVVAAREDQLMPVALMEEIADAIPGAKLAVIEDCGHLSPLEQPDQVTRLLAEWLH